MRQFNPNTPQTHQIKPPNWFDIKRYKKMLKYWQGGDLLDIGSFGSNLPILAKEKYPNSNVEAIDWFMGSTEKKYDYITLGQVLEHTNCPKAILTLALRMLKQNGVLALSVPLEETEKGEVDKEHHLWSFAKQDIIQLLKPYGKVKTKIIRSRYFPIYKYHFPHIIAYCKKI